MTLPHALRWRRHLVAFMTLSAFALTQGGCLFFGDDDPEPPMEEPTDPSDPSDPSDPNDPSDPDEPKVQPTPPDGQTTFVSADGRNGQRTQENEDAERNQNNAEGDFAGDPGADDDNRTVEEGDIYRVLNGSQDLILNLNRYRGFQIIDFTDPSAPNIVGRVQLAGTPVEMYQVGDRVFVLLNNWTSYWRSSRFDTTPQRHQGGGVAVIDISDRSKPTITSQALMDGWIRKSRLTRGGGKEALFVVSSEYSSGGGLTHVQSYSVSSTGKLAAATKLELGGYVQDIQATPECLIVARRDQALSMANPRSRSSTSPTPPAP